MINTSKPISSWLDDMIAAASGGLTLAGDGEHFVATSATSRSLGSLEKVPADAIQSVLDEGSLGSHHRKLSLANLWITGPLDLSGRQVHHSLGFFRCYFDSAISFRDSRVSSLNLSGSLLTGADLEGIEVEHDLFAHEVVTIGAFDAAGAIIKGQLGMNDFVATSEAGSSLRLDHVNVAGGLFMQRAKVRGSTNLATARVGGVLTLDGSHFSNPMGRALSLDGVQCEGPVVLTDMTTFGTIGAVGIRAQSIDFGGSQMTAPLAGAVYLDTSTIRGNVSFVDGRVTGGVSLRDIVIESNLIANDAEISNPFGLAMNFSGAKVGGSVFLHRTNCIGAVFGNSVRIGGAFAAQDTRIAAPGEVALALGAAEIERGLTADRLDVVGAVTLHRASIRGDVVMDDAKVFADRDISVGMDGIHIEGILRMNNATIDGEFRVCGARVDGQVQLLELEVLSRRQAVSFEGTIVGGSIHVTPRHLHGQLDFIDMTAPRLVVGPGKTSVGVGSYEVLADRAKIDVLKVEANEFGRIYLRLTDSILDRMDVNLPAQVTVDSAAGVKIAIISGPLLQQADAVETIVSFSDYVPRTYFLEQPWTAFADALANSGKPDVATRLRYKAAARATSVTSMPTRWIRTIYGALVGHGYYPLFSLGWIVVVFLVAWLTSSLSVTHFAPADWRFVTQWLDFNSGESLVDQVRMDSESGYPAFSPFLFALETAIPAATVGQSSQWIVYGSPVLGLWFAVLRAASWVLAALFLAGLTGILRRR